MASSVLELLHHKEREDGDTNDKEKTKDDNNTGWEHCQWIVDIRVSWKKGKEEEEGEEQFRPYYAILKEKTSSAKRCKDIPQNLTRE